MENTSANILVSLTPYRPIIHKVRFSTSGIVFSISHFSYVKKEKAIIKKNTK